MPACLNALGFYIYYSYNISLRFIVTAGRGIGRGVLWVLEHTPPPPFAIACRRGFAPIVHGACAVWHLPCTRMRTCYMMCQTTHAPFQTAASCWILIPLAPISCLTIPSSLSPPKKSLMPASVVLTQYSSLVDRYIIQ